MDPMLELNILPADAPGVADEPVEIVERKGLGHPDSLCDGAAEALAVALARHYRQRAGGLLHFNLDKILLVAGAVERTFGGGRWQRPIRLFVGDRAALRHGGQDLGVGELIQQRAAEWFGAVLPALDPRVGLEVVPVLGPGSSELSGLFAAELPPRANDTSAVVGYAPLSPVERLVLELERHLNGSAFKQRHDATGQDVKILAVRRGRVVDLTVAMPFLAGRVPSLAAYQELKRVAAAAALAEARRLLPADHEVALTLNALDDFAHGSEGVYLTLAGTSAEHGDSGEVGRGNRANGLIPLMRPGGAEAVAGKNPYCHVGKIYSVLAFQLAQEFVREVAGVRCAQVWLVSRIGAPLDQPRCVNVSLIPAPGARAADLARPVRERVRARLAGLPTLCRELEAGVHPVS